MYNKESCETVHKTSSSGMEKRWKIREITLTVTKTDRITRITTLVSSRSRRRRSF